MPALIPDHGQQQPLRTEAEIRLRAGTAPLSKHSLLSTDALMLLYRLASDPLRASDGLKLLHELQVHQVELDLQREQLDANERDVFESLTRYKTFFESAPVPFFIVTFDGEIIEGNLAGARLFGVAPGALDGHLLASVLTAESAPALCILLTTLHNDVSPATCRVTVARQQALLRLDASITPRGDTVLLVISALPA